MTSPKVKFDFISVKCDLIICETCFGANTPYSMVAGTRFKRLIPDQGPANQSPAQVKRVIFCSGKVYYELAKERKLHNLESDVAIVRLEQVFNLSPLSEDCGFQNKREMPLSYFTYSSASPTDLSIPVRPGQSRGRKVCQRRAGLVSGGAQEHGLL